MSDGDFFFNDVDSSKTPEAPQAYADMKNASLAPSESERFGALFGEGSTTGIIARAFQRNAARIEATPDPSDPNSMPENVMSPKDINDKLAPMDAYGNKVKIADEPMPEGVARVIAKQKEDEMRRQDIISRASGVHSALNDFGAGATAFMLDPINLASTFVPGIGEENALVGIGRLGFQADSALARTGARLVAGGTAGAAGQAPLVALKYGLGQGQASDYDLRSAFSDLAFASAGGAILHAGFGAIGDAYKNRIASFHGEPVERGGEIDTPHLLTEGIGDIPPEAAAVMDAPASVKDGAMRSAVSQITEGRMVDVDPVLPKSEEPSINGDAIAEQQHQIYREGFAPGFTSDELVRATEDLLPIKENSLEQPAKESPQLEQKVIDRYKKTVADEAQRIGIPLDEATLDKAASLIAESHNQKTPPISLKSALLNTGVPFFEESSEGGITEAQNGEAGGNGEGRQPVQRSAQAGENGDVLGQKGTDGEQLDLSDIHPEDAEIADLESKIDTTKMTEEERGNIASASNNAALAQSSYEQKLKELASCLAENGV